MRKWLLFVLACGAGFSSIAQTASPLLPSEDASALAREQWRIELRTVLSTYRDAEQSEQSEKSAPPTVPAAGLRQLSSQERAEMREQLRRYQPRKQLTRP